MVFSLEIIRDNFIYLLVRTGFRVMQRSMELGKIFFVEWRGPFRSTNRRTTLPLRRNTPSGGVHASKLEAPLDARANMYASKLTGQTAFRGTLGLRFLAPSRGTRFHGGRLAIQRLSENTKLPEVPPKLVFSLFKGFPRCFGDQKRTSRNPSNPELSAFIPFSQYRVSML